MSTNNICFYGEITKIIPKLSSNTLICSTADGKITMLTRDADLPVMNIQTCNKHIIAKSLKKYLTSLTVTGSKSTTHEQMSFSSSSIGLK